MGKSKDLASGAAYQDQTESDTRYVNTAGDTMTGALTVSGSNGELLNVSSTSGSELAVYVDGNEISFRADADNNNNDSVMTFDLDGSEKMRIDGSGRVTMPNQPAFKAFSTPYGWTSFGSTNNTLMPFNAVQHNVGNHYSTSNYRFTAPVAGVYYFYGQWYSDGNTFGELLIRQNGSAEKAFARNNSQSVTVQCATTLSLSANDYIEMFGKISNSDGSDWYSYNSYSYFCGYLIG